MTRPPEPGRKVMIVRLSMVPLTRRQRAAERLIRNEGLVGEAALEMILAAIEPRSDPWLMVPADAAARALRT